MQRPEAHVEPGSQPVTSQGLPTGTMGFDAQ
jgi:hypothetical protein